MRARTLPVAFLAVSLLIALVGLLAVREQHTASLRTAQIEAQHVAESIAYPVAHSADVGGGRQPKLYRQRTVISRSSMGVISLR